MNEKEFAIKYLREYKIEGKEIKAKYCIFCNGGQHHDQNTFSINTEKHTYGCLRGKCGERGTFRELCEKYNEQADYYLEWLKDHQKEYVPAKTYIAPKFKIEPLSAKVIKYFNGRGISKETLEKAGVKTFKGKYEEFAAFQFYEGDKLVMNKIRLIREPKIIPATGKKERKEWKEEGGKHVLWNMQNVNPKEPVILTEGMIDALSVIEAGFDNVVSIPSGTKDMTWIENCYNWILNVIEWILYVDNDEAGESLSKELSLKFKSYKTRIVKHELKDANEELQTLGTDYIKTVIEKAEFPAIEGINNLATVKIVDPTKMERILTGISIIDQYCGGFIFPSLNIWTGERGSGKSTVASQALLNCIDKGYNIFVYSGELMSGFFKLWMYLQAAGERNIRTEIDMETRIQMCKPNPGIETEIDKWTDGKTYIYDDTFTNEENKIFELMEEAYKRYNCRVFLLDNLMTIKFNSNKEGTYRAQSDFMDRLRGFVKNNNLVVNVVVHPNKAGEIGGAGEIRNTAFNEFWVKKINPEEDNEFPGYNTTISITKNRYYCDTDITRAYKFSKKSRRIFQKFEDEKIFGWEKKEYVEVDSQCPF